MGLSTLARVGVSRRLFARAVLRIAALFTCATPLIAQRTHVVIVAGLSGEPAFKRSFETAALAIRDAARTKWGVQDSSLIVLTEDSVVGPASNGRSTRERMASTFVALSKRVQPGDVVLVVLMGHGSGDGAESKVNVPGPDPVASEYASWLAGFSRETVVFVNTASGSGDFLPVLAAPSRVVITSTKASAERNESVFLGYFAKGLTSDEADANKDGRVSVLEAYRYARTAVARAYETTNRLQTEHAQISDSLLAGTVAFGGAQASNDPRIAALVAERQTLETQVATLRSRKTTMTAADYDGELERLLLAIAEKTQAIRAAGVRK